MHIRGELSNPYSLKARLYYPDGPSNDPLIFSFDVESPASAPDLEPFDLTQGKPESD
jgi:hypothetical protein